MRKWTVPALIAALGVAVLLRLEPLWSFSIWGSDSGEYYTLTKGIVSHGFISTPYWGWGLGYPYFPGAEVLLGATNIVTSIDLVTLLRYLLPILGSLVPLVAFLIGWTAFRDERAGLIAAGIVAVAMPEVFATSHSMPGTLGDLLAGLCILLYLKLYENKWNMVPLVLASLALVPTHHLSALFVFAPLLFIVIMRELFRSTPHQKMGPLDVGYLGFMLSANLVYWLGVAIPFRDQVMVDAFGVSPVFVALGAMAVMLVAYLVIRYRHTKVKFRYEPKLPTMNRMFMFLGIAASIILAWLAFTAFVEAPGTNITVAPAEVVYLLPVALTFSIAILGVSAGEFSRRGLIIWLWLASVSLILLLSIVTRNTVLVPYRVFEYVTLPAALMAGWGISFLADLSFDTGPGTSKAPRMALAVGVTGLLVLGAVTAYPPTGLLGGFQEGTTCHELGSVAWAGSEVPVRGSLVATDHRMSSMVFGFENINATWDSAYHTFHDDLNGSKAELKWVKVPSGHGRINYVLIDGQIKKGVALQQWENAQPMSKAAVGKFNEPPFNKIYESGDIDIYFVGLMA